MQHIREAKADAGEESNICKRLGLLASCFRHQTFSSFRSSVLVLTIQPSSQISRLVSSINASSSSTRLCFLYTGLQDSNFTPQNHITTRCTFRVAPAAPKVPTYESYSFVVHPVSSLAFHHVNVHPRAINNCSFYPRGLPRAAGSIPPVSDLAQDFEAFLVTSIEALTRLSQGPVSATKYHSTVVRFLRQAAGLSQAQD